MARSIAQKQEGGSLLAWFDQPTAALATIDSGCPVVDKNSGASTIATRQANASLVQTANTGQIMAIRVLRLRTTILDWQRPTKPQQGYVLVRTCWG